MTATYKTLKKSLRPDRRIWAAIDNVRTAQAEGAPVASHVEALSNLYHSFKFRRVGPVLDEAARVLEEAQGENLRAETLLPSFLHNLAA